jgi:hypothetical protein
MWSLKKQVSTLLLLFCAVLYRFSVQLPIAFAADFRRMFWQVDGVQRADRGK